jgi:hypothetical protein
MPLSKAQQELLNKYQIPEDLQAAIAKELGEDGLSKPNRRDFLQLISDKLQEAENLLYIKRQELASELKKVKGYDESEKPRQIIRLEEGIKEYWATATALWRTADHIVNRSEEGFKTPLSLKHAEYAIKKQNLPVLELIRWARPDWFTRPVHFPFWRRISWGIGGIGGAILGLGGGFLGGFRYGMRRHIGLAKLTAISYAFMGIFIGWAVGGVMGARLGFLTGNPLLACGFGAKAAFLNPLNEPRGTLNRHAVELEMEQTLFNLAKKDLSATS